MIPHAKSKKRKKNQMSPFFFSNQHRPAQSVEQLSRKLPVRKSPFLVIPQLLMGDENEPSIHT